MLSPPCRVLFLSASDIEGGAAIASYRLFQALRKKGLDVKMLVGHKESTDPNIWEAENNIIYWAKRKLSYYTEKIKLSFLLKNRGDVFFFSSGEYGVDLSGHPLVKQADILHYHWINHAFLSVHTLKKLVALGKPVISHLHDMWAFTGGCHYSGDCDHYLTGCGQCPYLTQPGENDISARISQAKKQLYQADNICFVASSKYLSEVAGRSWLLRNKSIFALPIPIDTSIHRRNNPVQSRKALGISLDKTVILFGAQNVAHKRKGMSYFIDAINLLASQYSEFRKNVEVAVFGKSSHDVQAYFPVPVKMLGTLNINQLNDAYSASDVYVIPSLEDNLPNTVLEALACQTPVVAFRTGGILEMVDHMINGYLADYRSVQSLADGIMWAISYKPAARLNESVYGIDAVTDAFFRLYVQLINHHRQKELKTYQN